MNKNFISKKTGIFLLTGAMVFGLAACGQKKPMQSGDKMKAPTVKEQAKDAMQNKNDKGAKDVKDTKGTKDNKNAKDAMAPKGTEAGKSVKEMKEGKNGSNIGKFETSDLDNNKVTQEIFKENKLTMVNVFSSTCNSCMEELPHLAELSKEYKDKKVGIVGLNIDVDTTQKPDDASKKAVLDTLADKKGDMKVVFVDKNLADKFMKKADILPYTFFVDKDGNIVGEEYLGAHSKEDWAKIIDKELEKVAENK